MAVSASLPNDLIVMRHGQSEGNILRRLERDNRPFEHLLTPEFRGRPGSTWGLSPDGVRQAKIMGAWLQPELNDLASEHTGPMGFQVSPFRRARHTAGHMDLVDPTSRGGEAIWRLNRILRERDWGDIETMSMAELHEAELYLTNLHKKNIDPLYWRPPGGESMAEVAEGRVIPFLESLTTSRNTTVVAVCHGETMRAFNMVIRRTNDEDYVGWDDNRKEKIRNCEVFHYSRFDPTRKIRTKDFTWVRRARPVLALDPEEHQDRVEVDPWINFTPEGLLTNAELLDH